MRWRSVCLLNFDLRSSSVLVVLDAHQGRQKACNALSQVPLQDYVAVAQVTNRSLDQEIKDEIRDRYGE